MNIADFFIAYGMAWFLFAEFRQIRKLIKLWKKHKITSISLTHYNWKLQAILSTLIGYSLARLPLSAIVICIELAITIIIVHMIKENRKLTVKEYLKEWI